MVVMIIRENKGWTKIWIATRRTGLKGDKNQRASVPENLKVKNILLVQPLLNPNEGNVWKPCQVRGRGMVQCYNYLLSTFQKEHMILVCLNFLQLQNRLL